MPYQLSIALNAARISRLHGAPCKILRTTHEVVHYIRNGRICIASMGRFNQDFEPLTKAQAERIAEEIETAEHLKKLRAQRAA